MKKLIALCFAFVFIISAAACATTVPPSQYPGIFYDGADVSKKLPTYSVLICRNGAREDTDGIGSELSPGEIISEYGEKIPITEISEGELTLLNGVEYVPSGFSSEKIEHSISFVGIYTADGVKTVYKQAELSSLPEGKYIICTETVKNSDDETEINYLFAGIDKKTKSAD